MNKKPTFNPARSAAIEQMLGEEVERTAMSDPGPMRRIVFLVSLIVAALLLAGGGTALALGVRPFFAPAPVSTPTQSVGPSPQPTETRPLPPATLMPLPEPLPPSPSISPTLDGYDVRAAWEGCKALALERYPEFTDYDQFDPSDASVIPPELDLDGIQILLTFHTSSQGEDISPQWLCYVNGDRSSPTITFVGPAHDQ
jgi:hypothetical protein